MIIVPAAQAEQHLTIIIDKDFLQRGYPVIDLPGNFHRLDGILWAKGCVIGEVVQEKLGRFKTETIGANVQKAGLHGFQCLCNTGNCSAIGFDKIDRVIGFLGHAAGDFRNEEVVHDINVDCRAKRVACTDAQRNIVSQCAVRSHGEQAGRNRRCCQIFFQLLHWFSSPPLSENVCTLPNASMWRFPTGFCFQYRETNMHALELYIPY